MGPWVGGASAMNFLDADLTTRMGREKMRDRALELRAMTSHKKKEGHGFAEGEICESDPARRHHA